jgi:acylphosphatase
LKTQKIQVNGKVQGVYFRASAKQQADLLGVKGTVKNQNDGSVLIEVEGKKNSIKKMVKWCKHGPALARVSEVKKETQSPQNFKDFSIIH